MRRPGIGTRRKRFKKLIGLGKKKKQHGITIMVNQMCIILKNGRGPNL